MHVFDRRSHIFRIQTASEDNRNFGVAHDNLPGGVGTISATANVNPAAIHKLYKQRNTADDADQQQSKLNVVRQVFSSRKFPSMIAALKQAIAIYADDPAWRTVRPPLVELTPEQAKTLAAELKAISFTMPGVGVSKG